MDKCEIWDILHQAIAEVSPFAIEQLEAMDESERQDAFLVSLGINSINYAEIVHIVSGSLNLELPLVSFLNVNRIGDVVGVFNSTIAMRVTVTP